MEGLGGIALGVENLATWAHELAHASDDRLGHLTERGPHLNSETVAELGGATLLQCLGMNHDADLGGCWQYIQSYASRNKQSRRPATRAYEDYRDLIESVENKWEPTTTTLSNYAYAYDTIGRPQHVIRTGTAFTTGHSDVWQYDDRNELEDAQRFDDTTVPLTSNPDTTKFFNWLYDNAGNRSDYDVGSRATEQTDYFANALNQYTWTDYDGPGSDARQSIEFDDDGNLETIFITGDMNCDGAFNGGDVWAFKLALSDPATNETTFPNCNILNGDINGDGLVDDADGDYYTELLTTGNTALWVLHTWNAENRLIAVEPAGTSPNEGVTKVAFVYDYLGRRIEKKV